ncbi:hypothetical protein [Flavobacterium sp. PL02]|uniref:hypothetical protein n=1 Tax=Flavobacterium sp. PL02 TaxID=3088354 RepID=UPI002B23CE6D|nr:hypothetical protein [Flavobacterium sp. PL02]MEA9414284.1 hypothetical protein [Flavobacterium sp. PL02]
MKKLQQILTMTILLITVGCNTEELDKATAAELIKKEYHYPKVVDYDIFCSDPEHARKLLKGGLEDKGFVIVQRTQKLRDIGKPLITFTEKAQPYFLPTSHEDKEHNIQKVKIADEVFESIKDITSNSPGEKAIVSYTTIRTNTIFNSLFNKDLTTVKEHKAYFIRTKNGWQIMRKSDFEGINF